VSSGTGLVDRARAFGDRARNTASGDDCSGTYTCTSGAGAFATAACVRSEGHGTHARRPSSPQSTAAAISSTKITAPHVISGSVVGAAAGTCALNAPSADATKRTTTAAATDAVAMQKQNTHVCTCP